MATTETRKFVVRVQNQHRVGPFVVVAASIDDAFRATRRKFASYFTDHVSRETQPLECEGVVSDCTGQRLQLGGRGSTYGRHPVRWHRAAV